MAEIMEKAIFHLTEVDRATLAMANEEFIPDTWDDVKKAIEAKDLSTLPRSPSILRRYMEWSQETVKNYGSVAGFLLRERCKWQSDDSTSTSAFSLNPKVKLAFADKSDYRILFNDWPYGLTPDITHLVVWLKHPLHVFDSGELVGHSRDLVQGFVEKTFVQRMKDDGIEGDCVMWFKNIPKLQSVGALEHFHVILRGATEEMLGEWTKGDVPMYRR